MNTYLILHFLTLKSILVNLNKKTSKKSSKELINKLMRKENKTFFLQKYKTKELIDLITRLNNKEINKNEHNNKY